MSEALELAAWLLFCQHNKGYTTATCYNYRQAIKHFAAWLEEQGIAITTATPEQLQKYAGEILHGRGQKSSTRRVAVSALRGYYKHLVSRRHIAASPAEHLPFPKTGRPLPLPIPADEVSKIMAKVDLSTFKGVRDLAILSVLTTCGPRVSGVSGLNEEDLLFGKNEHGLEELNLLLREKGRVERYMPAPDETRLMVRAYLGHPALAGVDRASQQGGTVLFVNLINGHRPAHERRGEARRMSPWSIHQMIQGYGREAGVPERFLHPHAFRHLFGQELAEHDVDILVRKALMGHERIESTEIYSHIAFRKMRAAADKANPLKRIKHPASGLAAKIREAMRVPPRVPPG